MSERVSTAERSSKASRAMRVKKWAVRVNERTSERTSKRPNTYIWILFYSGPLDRSAMVIRHRWTHYFNLGWMVSHHWWLWRDRWTPADFFHILYSSTEEASRNPSFLLFFVWMMKRIWFKRKRERGEERERERERKKERKRSRNSERDRQAKKKSETKSNRLWS